MVRGEAGARITDEVRRPTAAGETVVAELAEHHVVMADPESTALCA